MKNLTQNIVGEIQVSYNQKIKSSELFKIASANDAYNYIRNNSLFEDSKIEHIETMLLIVLNRANKVLGWAKISTGGTAGTVCDPKVIFQIALNCNASAIMLVHNHPSGNLTPSNADLVLTKKVRQGGELLDINLLDHLIVTSESYYSLGENGQL